MKKPIFYILPLLLSSDLLAQVSFYDASSKLPSKTAFYSFLHQSVADMNQDGKDDIVRADNSGEYNRVCVVASHQPYNSY